MKTTSHISLTFLLFFSFCAHSMQKTSEQLSPSATQVILSFFTSVGSSLLEILAFDPNSTQMTKKRRRSLKTRITNALVIIAPEEINIEQEGRYFFVNHVCYDAVNLTGKLSYENKQLVNKKGTIIDPLI